MIQDNNRRCEILVDDVWIESDFGAIRSGDLFRLFEGDKPVTGQTGQTTFEAVGDVYCNRYGVRTVNVGI